MPASDPLRVTDLVMRHGTATAVDGVSFRLTAGTVLGLLGSNGAGKTTTVEACEGYQRPAGGQVRLLGVDPVEHRDNLMPYVGVMLQDGGCYPGARAIEMLRLHASFAAHPLDIDALCRRLGLDRVARTAYRHLSGGERQRLSLALAVVGRPTVLFLDEPTAGMDPRARQDTWELIAQLRAAGAAILLTTHLLDEAEALADHLVILHRGRTIATGTPAQLTAAGGTRRVRLHADPGLQVDALRVHLPASAAVTEPRPGEYLIDAIGAGALTAALGQVTSWATGITDLHTEARSLEEVFFDLTEQPPEAGR
jgi:ABC-2 type transport system ATP-binding protein